MSFIVSVGRLGLLLIKPYLLQATHPRRHRSQGPQGRARARRRRYLSSGRHWNQPVRLHNRVNV